MICIAASSRASRAMEVVTVSHIHLASRLSSGTRTSRGVLKILTSDIVLEIDYT